MNTIADPLNLTTCYNNMLNDVIMLTDSLTMPPTHGLL
jgi:hypothetical protein